MSVNYKRLHVLLMKCVGVIACALKLRYILPISLVAFT